MATQWGRKESIIWPAARSADELLCCGRSAFCSRCSLHGRRMRFQVSPLQKAYLTDSVRAGVGSTFRAHQSYRLLYLGGSKAKPRPALPVDFVDGTMTLPDGNRMPFTLSELAQAQGYSFPFRGPAVKLADASMYRWLHDAIYGGESPWRTFLRQLHRGQRLPRTPACTGSPEGHSAVQRDEIWPCFAWSSDA